jgi:hypothetical protein
MEQRTTVAPTAVDCSAVPVALDCVRPAFLIKSLQKALLIDFNTIYNSLLMSCVTQRFAHSRYQSEQTSFKAIKADNNWLYLMRFSKSFKG